MRVSAYRNLHKGLWSVKSMQQPTYGRVIDRTDSVLLYEPLCNVSQGGRERVLREGRKNVHADVRGLRLELELLPMLDGWQPLTYNPYKYTTFVDRTTEQPVWTPKFVWLDPAGKAWYKP